MNHCTYPKWKYHAEKPACIVTDEAEESSLGLGWVDSPAAIIASEPALAPKPEPKAPRKTGSKGGGKV
jgi:hypothetical protein